MLAHLIDADDVLPHLSSADVPTSPPQTPSRLPGPHDSDNHTEALCDLGQRYIAVRNVRQAAWTTERNQLLELLDQQSHTMALMSSTHQQELDLAQADIVELEHELREVYAQLNLRRTESKGSLPVTTNDSTTTPVPAQPVSNFEDLSLDLLEEEGRVHCGEGDESQGSQKGEEVERLRAQLVQTQLLLRTEREERTSLQSQVDALRLASHQPSDHVGLENQKQREAHILSAYKQVKSELLKVQACYHGRNTTPTPDLLQSASSSTRSARRRSASPPLSATGTTSNQLYPLSNQGSDATMMAKTTSGSSMGSPSGSSDSLSTLPARPALKRLSLVSGGTTTSLASGLVRAQAATRRSPPPGLSWASRSGSPLPPITTGAVRRPTAHQGKGHLHYVASDSGKG